MAKQKTFTLEEAQTLVPSSGQNIQLQRMGSDAGGNALVLWTESDGMRTALKAIHEFLAYQAREHQVL